VRSQAETIRAMMAAGDGPTVIRPQTQGSTLVGLCSAQGLTAEHIRARRRLTCRRMLWPPLVSRRRAKCSRAEPVGGIRPLCRPALEEGEGRWGQRHDPDRCGVRLPETGLEAGFPVSIRQADYLTQGTTLRPRSAP
jgi:hypothetical protein